MILLKACVICASLALVFTEEAAIPPEITMNEPAILYKKEGEKFSLKCSATGLPEPTVNWVKINNDVYPEVNATETLNFDSFTREQGGTYQCVATNPHGTTVSGYVQVHMIYIGNLKTENTTTIKVTEGDPVVIECQKEQPGLFSYPEPEWSWYVKDNGKMNPLEYPRMAVDKEGRLHIAHVNVSDGDDGISYVCKAKNNLVGKRVMGSETILNVTEAATAIPAKAPELSYSNTNKAKNYNVKVEKGQIVVLHCIFKGYPEFDISWESSNGDPLPGGTLSTEGGTKLIVDSKIHASGLTLKCIGNNTEGEAESAYDIIVEERPKFISAPFPMKNVNTTEGEEVHFQCNAEAMPRAKVEWMVNNKVVPAGDTSEPRRTIDQKGNYRFTGLKKTDNHVVTCRAMQTTDGKNYAIFKSAYINVLKALNITIQPAEDVMVSSFCDVIVIDGQADSDPIDKPTITWYRNDEKVTEVPEQIYKVKNNSLIINATKFCRADDIAGVYHFVAKTNVPLQKMASEKCNVTLDPTGNFTRVAEDNSWCLLTLCLDPWWIWLIILAALILLHILFLICFICCCCKRRKRPAKVKEEESGDLEAMLGARPSKLDDPEIEQLFKKYIILMGDGSLVEEDVSLMPQACFHHLLTRMWPVIPYLKQEDFETCYQSHYTYGEKGLSFQSFHSALNELINTNDSRLHDSLPRRQRSKIPNFHTKEKIILMFKIVADPEKDPVVVVNDLKFAIRGLERLNYNNGAPVVTTTAEKALNGIGYGNFWLLKISHLVLDLIRLAADDETSKKDRWSCDCGSLQKQFNHHRWHFIRVLYEVIEFLNFTKRTELYRSQKIEKDLNKLNGILEVDKEHLAHSGFGEPKRTRAQVYERMATQIDNMFFKRYLRRSKVDV